MKLWHDKNLWVKELEVGQKVLLFQSRLKLMPGKLKSKWIGPYTIERLRANRAVEIQGSTSNSDPFLVNGHRVKVFWDSLELCVVEKSNCAHSLLLPKKSSDLSILQKFPGQVNGSVILNLCTDPEDSKNT